MRLLIIKFSAIGDIFQSIEAVYQIKKQKPNMEISWVIEAQYAHLLHHLEWIKEVIPIDIPAIRKNPWNLVLVFQSVRKIKRSVFDCVIDLQSNLKSFFVLLLFPFTKKVGVSSRYVKEKIATFLLNEPVELDLSLNQRKRYEFVLSRACRLPLNQTSCMDPIFLDGKPKKQNQIEKGYLVAIGAKWPNKQLFFDQWERILTFILEKENRPISLVYHTDQEEKIVNALIQRHPRLIKEKKTDLSALQRKMEGYQGVIGVDSAIVHLAGLAKIPTFTIFGPSSGKVYGPLNGSFYQGSCPIPGIIFDKRCPKLRSCSHGNCLKNLPMHSLLFQLDAFVKSI